MKTEAGGSGDVIWTTSVELPHLTHEECLPVIGSCQVSSILSNLDGSTTDKIHHSNVDVPQSMDLIVLENTDYKVSSPVESGEEITNDFIVLKENANHGNFIVENKTFTAHSNTKKIKKVKVDDLEKTLYFVCNECRFLCIKDIKMSEHFKAGHKTTTKLAQLKCPACLNIFYHKVSLRSHLIHDHHVGNADLRRIIQAVVYSSKKKSTTISDKAVEEAKNETLLPTSCVASISCKNELELKYIEKLTHTEKILNDDDSLSNEAHSLHVNPDNILLHTPGSVHYEQRVNSIKHIERSLENSNSQVVNLPTMDISHNNTEKMFNNIIKQPNILSKYLDKKKLHKCTVSMCKVRLQDSSKMNYHVKCHTESSFKCLECDETFAFWKPLTGHLWRIHKIDMELYSCDKCDYKTYSLGKLNSIHKLIHGDLKAYLCEVCRKGFKNSKQLRNHKITHKEKSEKLTHVCEVCAKAFSDKRQLRVHMDGVHKKIKPFLCNYCGYKGSTKSALKMHIRQHTGEKPFSCDVCDYNTADHNSLRRHKLRHSGQKPYKCPHCDYACIQSSTYKVHVKTKHPGLENDLMFACSECQFRTVNQDLFLSHLSSVHKQQKHVYV